MENAYSLPEVVLYLLIERWENDIDAEVKNNARSILRKQPILPLAISQRLGHYVGHEEFVLRKEALNILQSQRRLPEDVLAQVIRQWKQEENEEAKNVAIEIIIRQPTLCPMLLNELTLAFNQASATEKSQWLKRWDEHRIVLSQTVLAKVNEWWEHDSDKAVKAAALPFLLRQETPSWAMIDYLQHLLNEPNGRIKKQAKVLAILQDCHRLSETILASLLTFLENAPTEALKQAAQTVIAKQYGSFSQSGSPLALIQRLANCLESKEPTVNKAALEMLQHKPLPEKTLLRVSEIWEAEPAGKIKEAAQAILYRQPILPLSLLYHLLHLLSCSTAVVRGSACAVLNEQQELPLEFLCALLEGSALIHPEEFSILKVKLLGKNLRHLLENTQLQKLLSTQPGLLIRVIIAQVFARKSTVSFHGNTLTLMGSHPVATFNIIDSENVASMFNQAFNALLNSWGGDKAHENGEAKFKVKDYAGAIADFTQVIHLSAWRFFRNKSSCYNRRGWAKLFAKMYPAAIEDACHAIKLNTSYNEFSCNLLPWACLFDKQSEQAITIASTPLSLIPKPEAQCILTLGYFAQGKLDHAFIHLQQACAHGNNKDYETIMRGDYGCAFFILAQLLRLQEKEAAYNEMLDFSNAFYERKYVFIALKEQLTKWLTQHAPKSAAHSPIDELARWDSALEKLVQEKKPLVMWHKAAISFKNGYQKYLSGDYAGAIVDYTVAIHFSPHQTHYILSRGWTRMLCKDEGALEDASSVIALEPKNAKAYRQRAWSYLFALKMASAKEAAEKALQLELSWKAYGILMLIAFQEGGLTEVCSTVWKTFTYYWPMSGLEKHFVLALLYLLSGEEEAYEKHVLKLQQKKDDVHIFNLVKEWITIVEKQSLEEKEKTAKAEVSKNSNVIRNPALAVEQPIYSYKAAISYKKGRQKFIANDYAGAIANYTTSINLESHHADCYTSRGWIRMLCKEYQKALEDVSRVIVLESNNANAYRNRAWAYLFNMQRTEALSDINQALKLEEDSGEAYSVLALIAFQEGDLTKALTIAQQAVALKEHSAMLFILAQLYRLKGDEQAYQTELLKAQRLGDGEHLFSLLEEWIMIVEKQLIEKKESAAETEKSEIIMHSAQTFLPSYTTQPFSIEAKMGRLSLDQQITLSSEKDNFILPSQEKIQLNYAKFLSSQSLTPSHTEDLYDEELNFDEEEQTSLENEEKLSAENDANNSSAYNPSRKCRNI